jgi:hypothetical protein
MKINLFQAKLNYKKQKPCLNKQGYINVRILNLYALTFPFTFAITSSAIFAGAGE